MKCSVFIATSADGFIATPDGSVDWLHTAGNTQVIMGDQSDMGMKDFMSTIDCIIMGRKTMEVIAAMNLTPEQWPYGNIRIIVLSNTLKVPPTNMRNKVEMYAGDIVQLVAKLESSGFKHCYIDGGTIIQAFLNLKLINEITITKAPIILGKGIPLFGNIDTRVNLKKGSAITFPNDFIQLKYEVSYS